MDQNKGGTEDLIADIVSRFFLAGTTFVASYLIQLLFFGFFIYRAKGVIDADPSEELIRFTSSGMLMLPILATLLVFICPQILQAFFKDNSPASFK